MAPFTTRSHSSVSSILTTLDGGASREYAVISQVERAIAVHLCPQNAVTWKNCPCLPLKACKLTAALSKHHSGVSPLPQPLDGLCLSTSRGAPRTSTPAYCCHSRCLHALNAICNGQAASGLRTGPRLLWHINCLELWAVHLALWQFRPLLMGKHVLVRTDNTAAVSYINRLGGIRSSRMSHLARHLLLWSHTQLKSLHAAHIPGKLNRAADALSRQLTFPGEW